MPSHTTPALLALLALPLTLMGCSSADSVSDSASSASSSPSLSSSASSGEAAGSDEEGSTTTVERFEANVIERVPFDASLFTQGLEVTPNGEVLVGTGQYGESGIFTLPVGSDSAQQHVGNEDDVFGEGLTQYDSADGPLIWQLSWDSGEAYKYDAESYELLDTVSYPGEGWGLCSVDDSSTLVMSDGTNELRHLDGESFEEQSRVPVTLDGQAVDNINELECVDVEVFANVWFSTDILRIDPATGKVTGIVDASGLENNAEEDPDHVLNGIAHIPDTDEYFLTGKRWPDMYRVSFDPIS
ncbi:glutaminyl-peptide cyclotransferase [Corynebacterium casei]|uniref:Glutamine cyclotransferase n=2 Tax=Corynebacterium casei TaxID=160386 RepID=A0ABM5PRI1_9CORY|nr:glutaminyl-peptide cyclotransferase [Corynebacterium casei]AHI20615.1 glutamine cyclotransferase [Corynebacterium casei LMG S-19264]